MNELTAPWYDSLIEDLKDLITEVEFTSRWTLVEGYHTLGSRILAENDNFEKAGVNRLDVVQHVANSMNKKPRTIYYAIKFARLYPDLNLLPEGKNCHWRHVINKYLTAGEEKPVKITPTEMIRQIKKLLQTEWLKAHQEVVRTDTVFIRINMCEFIRYLQDQVNKITGELNESK